MHSEGHASAPTSQHLVHACHPCTTPHTAPAYPQTSCCSLLLQLLHSRKLLLNASALKDATARLHSPVIDHSIKVLYMAQAVAAQRGSGMVGHEEGVAGNRGRQRESQQAHSAQQPAMCKHFTSTQQHTAAHSSTQQPAAATAAHRGTQQHAAAHSQCMPDRCCQSLYAHRPCRCPSCTRTIQEPESWQPGPVHNRRHQRHCVRKHATEAGGCEGGAQRQHCDPAGPCLAYLPPACFAQPSLHTPLAVVGRAWVAIRHAHLHH